MFSFVLGLIVVIVFLIVLNTRFNFVGNMFRANNGRGVAVVSPTPRPTAQPVPTTAAVARTLPTAQPTVRQTRQNVTPTSRPTALPTRVPTVMARANPTTAPTTPNAAVQSQVRGVNQIPNTGFPTEAIPLLAGAIYTGIRLRKMS